MSVKGPTNKKTRQFPESKVTFYLRTAVFLLNSPSQPRKKSLRVNNRITILIT